MRVLVTGAHGFVGGHVTDVLERMGHTPLAASHDDSNDAVALDVRDEQAARDVVRQLQPDACIHLAGIAFVPMGWRDPERVLSVNALGTINMLEALRQNAPRARFLLASSAEVYGRDHGDNTVTEATPMQPENPYALSKMTADLTTLIYHKRYDMETMSARPHNHVGPGQSKDFVIPSFSEQLLAIKAGKQEPIMHVGNLESERDFTDVRDIARAYVELLERGKAGEAYNIVSGLHVKISTIMEQLCEIVGVEPTLERDEARYRPTDRTPRISSDKIRREVEWEPQIELGTTLSDIVDSLRLPA